MNIYFYFPVKALVHFASVLTKRRAYRAGANIVLVHLSVVFVSVFRNRPGFRHVTGAELHWLTAHPPQRY